MKHNSVAPLSARWLALGLGGLLLAAICIDGVSAESRVDEKEQARPDLGPNASLRGYRPFPDDNPWNTPVDKLPVDAKSSTFIKSIGADKPLHPDFGAPYEGVPVGIPYVVVEGTQPKVPLTFEYADESDPGPYPIPADAPIEGGPQADADGDRHVLVLDRDNLKLYEVFTAFPDGKAWRAGAGAVFDLKSNKSRPARLDERRRRWSADFPRSGALRRSHGAKRDSPRAALHGAENRSRPTCRPLRTGPARAKTRRCRRWACACD